MKNESVSILHIYGNIAQDTLLIKKKIISILDVAAARASDTAVVTNMKEGLTEEEEVADGSEEEKSSISSITRTPSITSLSRLSPFRMISPKGVTLPMLIQDGIIDPGEKMLTMEYMVSVLQFF